jgi:DNA modification methylase
MDLFKSQMDTELRETIPLERLLSSDLNFEGKSGSYFSHNFHAFAAKFPPQLPKFFIENLTAKGEIVLDPMMGSGTTIVEGMLAGRRTIGFDIDPLAVQITSIKTNPLPSDRLIQTCKDIMDNVNYIFKDSPQIEEALNDRFDPETKKFINYWFFPETQKELMALVLAIEQLHEEEVKLFFRIILSSIIITKSGGVTKARDLAHTRPHLDKSKVPKNTYEAFSARVARVSKPLMTYENGNNLFKPQIEQCDARKLPIVNSSIHLILTSPPYANAIDYMRAHKFSLVWFGKSIKELSELRSNYIGSERRSEIDYDEFPRQVREKIEQISEIDISKGNILSKYFKEMRTVLKEMLRVLLPRKCAVIVVGSSTMRGIDTETHINLTRMAETLGFDLVGVAKRTLDRNKRMMPARFNKEKKSQIEHRMHEEFVIGLRKPGE